MSHEMMQDEIDTLDARMKAAGMITASELLRGGQPIDVFRVQAGMRNVHDLLYVAENKYAQYLRMYAKMELDGEQEDEMFQWVFAHKAVWGDVVVNLRAAISRGQEERGDEKPFDGHEVYQRYLGAWGAEASIPPHPANAPGFTTGKVLGDIHRMADEIERLQNDFSALKKAAAE